MLGNNSPPRRALPPAPRQQQQNNPINVNHHHHQQQPVLGKWIKKILDKEVNAGKEFTVWMDLVLGQDLELECNSNQRPHFLIIGYYKIVRPIQDGHVWKQVDVEREFWRQELQVGSQSNYSRGDHSYIKEIALPKEQYPSFEYINAERQEQFSVRYEFKAIFPSRDNRVPDFTAPLNVINPPMEERNMGSIPESNQSNSQVCVRSSRSLFHSQAPITLLYQNNDPASLNLQGRTVRLDIVTQIRHPKVSHPTQKDLDPVHNGYQTIMASYDLSAISLEQLATGMMLKLSLPHLPPSLKFDFFHISHELHVVIHPDGSSNPLQKSKLAIAPNSQKLLVTDQFDNAIALNKPILVLTPLPPQPHAFAIPSLGMAPATHQAPPPVTINILPNNPPQPSPALSATSSYSFGTLPYQPQSPIPSFHPPPSLPRVGLQPFVSSSTSTSFPLGATIPAAAVPPQPPQPPQLQQQKQQEPLATTTFASTLPYQQVHHGGVGMHSPPSPAATQYSTMVSAQPPMSPMGTVPASSASFLGTLPYQQHVGGMMTGPGVASPNPYPPQAQSTSPMMNPVVGYYGPMPGSPVTGYFQPQQWYPVDYSTMQHQYQAGVPAADPTAPADPTKLSTGQGVSSESSTSSSSSKNVKQKGLKSPKSMGNLHRQAAVKGLSNSKVMRAVASFEDLSARRQQQRPKSPLGISSSGVEDLESECDEDAIPGFTVKVNNYGRYHDREPKHGRRGERDSDHESDDDDKFHETSETMSCPEASKKQGLVPPKPPRKPTKLKMKSQSSSTSHPPSSSTSKTTTTSASSASALPATRGALSSSPQPELPQIIEPPVVEEPTILSIEEQRIKAQEERERLQDERRIAELQLEIERLKFEEEHELFQQKQAEDQKAAELTKDLEQKKKDLAEIQKQRELMRQGKLPAVRPGVLTSSASDTTNTSGTVDGSGTGRSNNTQQQPTNDGRMPQDVRKEAGSLPVKSRSRADPFSSTTFAIDSLLNGSEQHPVSTQDGGRQPTKPSSTTADQNSSPLPTSMLVNALNSPSQKHANSTPTTSTLEPDIHRPASVSEKRAHFYNASSAAGVVSTEEPLPPYSPPTNDSFTLLKVPTSSSQPLWGAVETGIERSGSNDAGGYTNKAFGWLSQRVWSHSDRPVDLSGEKKQEQPGASAIEAVPSVMAMEQLARGCALSQADVESSDETDSESDYEFAEATGVPGGGAQPTVVVQNPAPAELNHAEQEESKPIKETGTAGGWVDFWK